MKRVSQPAAEGRGYSPTTRDVGIVKILLTVKHYCQFSLSRLQHIGKLITVAALIHTQGLFTNILAVISFYIHVNE